MELGTEVLFTRLTGYLVFKNPKCKTCYQIIENSIFIYLVLPKTGKTWQHFLVSKKTKKGVEKTGKDAGSAAFSSEHHGGPRGGSWLCFWVAPFTSCPENQSLSSRAHYWS